MSETKSLPVYFTRSEQHRLLEVCQNDRDRLLVQLLRYTGGRISEVLAARVADIAPNGIRLANLKQGRWIAAGEGHPVRQHVSVREEKLVHLPADFLVQLRQAVSGRPLSAHIITHLDSDSPISRVRAWQIVTTLASRAGIYKRRFRDGELRPPGPHKLRHSHAVLLLSQGVPITVVQSQLGHKSLSSTQIYAQIADPQRERMIAAVQF